MSSRISLKVVLFYFATFVAVSLVTGQDQAPAILEDGQLLSELHQLRRAIGGGVLSGTLLESTPREEEADFDAGLRKTLGMPASKSGRESRNSKANLKVESSKLSNMQIVSMLRTYCSELDRISNGIEILRLYENADQLRQTATQLRLLARQFDGPTARSSSTFKK